MTTIRKLGASLLASAIAATGMLPAVAYADTEVWPEQLITGRWARLTVDQMYMMDDLMAAFNAGWGVYQSFDHNELYPELAQLTNVLDARCNGTPAKAAGVPTTTNSSSNVDVQRAGANLVLAKMMQATNQGGMGTEGVLDWFSKLKFTLVQTPTGQIDVKLMWVIWNNGSTTGFAVFKSGNNILLMQQGILPQPAPDGQGSGCPG